MSGSYNIHERRSQDRLVWEFLQTRPFSFFYPPPLLVFTISSIPNRISDITFNIEITRSEMSKVFVCVFVWLKIAINLDILNNRSVFGYRWSLGPHFFPHGNSVNVTSSWRLVEPWRSYSYSYALTLSKSAMCGTLVWIWTGEELYDVDVSWKSVMLESAAWLTSKHEKPWTTIWIYIVVHGKSNHFLA